MTTEEEPEKLKEMKTEISLKLDYEDFLKDVRNTVAKWVLDDKVKAVFAEHLHHFADLRKLQKEANARFNEELMNWSKTDEGHLDCEKRNARKRKWQDSNAGKSHCNPRPPPERRGGPREPQPVFEEDWFALWPHLGLSEEKKLARDYVLLAAVHDGCNWQFTDRQRYIAPDLITKGTITDWLWWFTIRREPRYKERIVEARQYVKKHLRECGLIDTRAARTGQEGIVGYMSSPDLAKHHGVDAEALRKRLDRHRAKHTLDSDLFVESQDRGKNRPKYLYDAEKVLPIIQELKKQGASVKRPSEET
jgi:hypothetical protein